MSSPSPNLITLTGREKILLVPVNGIGDCLMYLPAAWQLKRAAPGVRIEMLANRVNGAAAAMRLARGIDAVHEYALRGHGLGAYARFFLMERSRCVALIQREQYDYVATIIPNVFRRSILKFFPAERQLVEPDRKKNEYAAAIRTVNRFAGLPPGGGYGELIQVSNAEAQRQGLGVTTLGYLLLCLEGKSPARRYTDVVGLATALGKTTGRVVVLAGSSCDNSTINLPLGAIDLRGRTNWEGLAAVMDGAAAVVAVDGGALHLAVAMAKPVVGLFGPIHSSFRTPPYYSAQWRALDAGPRGQDGYERREDYDHPSASVAQIPMEAIVTAACEVLA